MVRDRIVATKLIRRAVLDIHTLMGLADDVEPDFGDLLLWSELEAVPAGTNWDDHGVPA